MKKRRYSFVGKKHKLEIDPDLQQLTEEYVKKQFAIMERYGGKPKLSKSEYSDLVYDIARHPQEIRNLRAKEQKREARKARKEPEWKKMKWWDGSEVNAD